MFFDGEMSQKRFDFRTAHLHRMPLVVEQDETLDPVDVGLSGTMGIVLGLDGVANLIEELLLRTILHSSPSRQLTWRVVRVILCYDRWDWQVSGHSERSSVSRLYHQSEFRITPLGLIMWKKST